MKKYYLFIMTYIVASILFSAFADTTTYGKVLYRVNAGGWQINSKDTSTVKWIGDDTHDPYIDTLTMGNKTYGVLDSVTLDEDIPASTPYYIFRTERNVGVGVNQLEYNFAIPVGQKIEVRLYFAENYLNSITERMMNIYLDNQEVLPNFDIYAEAGKNKGIMKTFIITSDGNLDIDLMKVKQLPSINGIEIIELNTITIASIFSTTSNALSFSAFPNPFIHETSIDLENHRAENFKVFDSYGREIEAAYLQSGSLLTIDMANYPKGIYYVQARIDKDKTGMLRLVKE